MTSEPEKEKMKRINHIKTLYAVNLFCLSRFEESMKIFVALDTGNTLLCFSLHYIPYFFGYKTELFSYRNNPKNLDPSL